MTTDASQPPPMLVQPGWLEQRLGDPALRILDCTTYMFAQPVGPSRIESGRADYERAHIPGTQHVDMVGDLSDPAGRYPYTIATPAAFEALCSRLGLGNDDHVVLYARSSPMTVTRAWFVFFAMGHRRLSVLDGGFDRWQREGRPLTAERPSFAPTRYSAHFDARRVAGFEDVRAAMADPGQALVNALSREQFAGTGGAHYGRPGRIPGSASVPARELADAATGQFVSLERMRELFGAAGVAAAGADPVAGAKRVIHYCGGGIAATTTAFALQLLGHSDWAVYDNSLLEWATVAEAPMARD